jgi:hypothetical protein
MNETNVKFKKLFTKMLNQVEIWQDTQQMTMDNLSSMISQCKHWSLMNNDNICLQKEPFDKENNANIQEMNLVRYTNHNCGIFAYFPHTVHLTQAAYIEQLEKLQQSIKHYISAQQDVCNQLNKLQNEAFSYFEQQKANLNSWMDLQRTNLHKSTTKFAKLYEDGNNTDSVLQHPYYIISNYLEEVQNIYLMFQKELNHKQKVIEQIDYMKSAEHLTELYQQLCQYKFVNVERVIEALEKAEREASK